MKIILVLISTIAVSTSARLFPNEVDKYKVSDENYQFGRIEDDSIKGNSFKNLDNENENSNLEPINIIKIKDFGVNMNQEKAQSKKLNKTFNFYAKRIYQEIDKSIENIKIRNSASPIKFVKKTKYSKEEKQDRKKDDSIKVYSLKSFDNEDENFNNYLEPRNIKKIKDFGVNMNQEKAKPKKLKKTFDFYAKRIYRNNNQEIGKSIENIKIRNSTASPVKYVKKMKYSKEEEQDQKEFIFLKNKNFEAPKNKRRIRSSNIIEEENLFTTVSALKYTGRDTRLTNDLYFKNINQ